ncbi:MAG: FHA domain-containing protein [Blastochloris sp.]|nr:FHA domain-containing protein [Blastochloris sp.]
MRGKLVSGEEKWGFEIPRIILGRGTGSDIQVSDPAASRQHAELWTNYNLQYMVMDCGSRNGTYLNDRLICGPTLLRQGDVIRIGQQRFEFNGNSSPQPQVPTSVIKVGEAQSAPKFPLAMLALRLFENAGALANEQIVHCCGLGQWFSKQIEIVGKHEGCINHLGKRMILPIGRPKRAILRKC